MVRRASCGLQRQAGCRVCKRTRLRSLSLGRRRSTRACCCTRRAALVVVGVRLRKALHRREASLLRRAAVVRRASCGLQRQAGCRVCSSAGAPALAVSGEEAQHSSLLRARAVPRWLWSVRPQKRRTHRREASLLRRAAVVRRASCSLQESAGFRVACASAPLRSLSLGRRRSTRACCARAPCRAGCGRPMPRKGTASARGLSPSARGRGATCQLRPPTPSRLSRVHARARHCARCLSGGGAARELAARARRAALVVVGLCLERRLHRREASLLRRAAVVRRASCGLQEPAGFRVAYASAPLRSLSLGRRRSTRACCARAPCRAGCGRP